LCSLNGGSTAWTGGTQNTLVFTPTNSLLANTSYTYSVIANTTGNNGVSVNYTATFTTGSGTNSSAPTVSNVVPSNGATGVDTSTNVRINFSKPMSPAIANNAVRLRFYGNAA